MLVLIEPTLTTPCPPPFFPRGPSCFLTRLVLQVWTVTPPNLTRSWTQVLRHLRRLQMPCHFHGPPFLPLFCCNGDLASQALDVPQPHLPVTRLESCDKDLGFLQQVQLSRLVGDLLLICRCRGEEGYNVGYKLIHACMPIYTAKL